MVSARPPGFALLAALLFFGCPSGEDDDAADDDATADDDMADDDTGDDDTSDDDAGDDDAGDDDGDDDLGVPYGFWGLNGYHSVDGFNDVHERVNMTVVQVASGEPGWTVDTFLPLAREAEMQVTLRLTGGHGNYTNNESFDIDAWKSTIDPWEDAGLQEFIDDGTLIGHMVLDDIANWSWLYNGTDPTGDELDEMARYSKEKIPGLMTFVRQRATEMPAPTGDAYVHLDACVNQYRILEGDVEVYATDQRAAALALDLGIINGLNLCDGGDGSSGQQGWRGPGFWAMSANEISTYGEALMVDGMGMFLAWEYDAEEVWPDGTIGADYLEQPELQAALADLGLLVAEQPRVELLKP